MYLLVIFEEYAASGMALLTIIFFECVAIGWGFGVDRYFEAIKEMIGFYPFIWFKLCWTVLCPAITLVSLGSRLSGGNLTCRIDGLVSRRQFESDQILDMLLFI